MALKSQHISRHSIATAEASTLCAVPLNPTHESVPEADMLSALHAIFGHTEDTIDPVHYAMPILMTAARGDVLEQLLEAWVMSGLFYSYNIVLSAATRQEIQRLQTQVFSQTCFRLYPQAMEHVAFYAESLLPLQQGVVRFLSNQEPHLYFCAEAQDTLCQCAAQQGFLVFSLAELPWLRHQHNGFMLHPGNARHLALQLIQILENPENDWEFLLDMTQRAQESLIAV